MRRKSIKSFIPIILVLLAFLDIRTELLIILDHLTVTSLIYTVKYHLLAITVLLVSPSLFQAYSKL